MNLQKNFLALLLTFCLAAPALSQQIIHVPAEMDLQTALDTAPAGSIVEIAAGVYNAPLTGFRIEFSSRHFTVRAAANQQVILDGGGVTDILRIRSNTAAVVLQDIEFANGFSNTDGIGSGVTVDVAEATFERCTFRNSNGQQPNTSGGAARLATATVYFNECTWSLNTAKNSGAGLSSQHSTAWIFDSLFESNNVAGANHRTTAAGGGIHSGNSTLYVANTRFLQNEAGYVGGAFFQIGTYVDPLGPIPAARAYVSNSTFSGNRAKKHPSVSFPFPTEGGGFHSEDDAFGGVYYSRFIENESDNGGGVNLYRAAKEIEQSVFLGNRAVGVGTTSGLGGAINALSNDTVSVTTNNGASNRPSASLTVDRSYFLGVYGNTTKAGGRGAGAIFAGGDNNRKFGEGGVTAMGSDADNMANVSITNSIFDQIHSAGPTAAIDSIGGGIITDFVNLDLQNSIFSRNEAFGGGPFGQGGALAVIGDSEATLTNLAFADNRATIFGGAIRAEGSNLSLSSSLFLRDEISPGENEGVANSYGAAMFSGPSIFRGFDMRGTISNNLFSDQIGMPIWDDDRQAGPINDLVWNQNRLTDSTIGATVAYTLDGYKTLPDFNTTVVMRTNGTSTDKSTVDNIHLGSSPDEGFLVTAPSRIVPSTAPGDPWASTQMFVGWAWTGSSATLNGAPEPVGVGSVQVLQGNHTLDVNGAVYQDQGTLISNPQASLEASSVIVAPGAAVTLSWSSSSGTFLAAAVDHGVGSVTFPGSVQVNPTKTTTYQLFSQFKEGGVAAPVTVFVDTDTVFSSGYEPSNFSEWN